MSMVKLARNATTILLHSNLVSKIVNIFIVGNSTESRSTSGQTL